MLSYWFSWSCYQPGKGEQFKTAPRNSCPLMTGCVCVPFDFHHYASTTSTGKEEANRKPTYWRGPDQTKRYGANAWLCQAARRTLRDWGGAKKKKKGKRTSCWIEQYSGFHSQVSVQFARPLLIAFTSFVCKTSPAPAVLNLSLHTKHE